MFSALGFSIGEARSRAFTLYAYEVAESLLSNQGTEAQKADRRALLEQLIVLPLPDVKAARRPARAAVTPTVSKVHKLVE